MIVIFEGPDGQGKTTLIEALSKHLQDDASNFEVYKQTTHKPGQETSFNVNGLDWNLRDASYWSYRYFLDIAKNQIASHDTNVIMDRFFPTQFVYQRACFPDTIKPLQANVEKALHEHIASVPHIYFYVNGGKLKDQDSVIEDEMKKNEADRSLKEWQQDIHVFFGHWKNIASSSYNSLVIHIDTSLPQHVSEQQVISAYKRAMRHYFDNDGWPTNHDAAYWIEKEIRVSQK